MSRQEVFFSVHNTCTNVYSVLVLRRKSTLDNAHPTCTLALRKHAYSNIKKISPPKSEIFQIKNSDTFHIPAQSLNCGYPLEPPRRGGSNEYPQSMFLSRNKKNNVYPCKPQSYYLKVGFKEVKIIKVCFRDVLQKHLNSVEAFTRIILRIGTDRPEQTF